ncbi:MAG: site-2 protease family protein [Planctomycetota bacterium]|jgi:Zn-dependent protease
MQDGISNPFMSQGWPWQWKLFRLLGIQVYLHLFFIIFIGMEMIFVSYRLGFGLITLYVTIELAILFGIVLLHEYGHALTARSQGGDAERIILWPLGGLALCSAPHRPKEQGFVAAGGPMVNVIIFVIFFPLAWWLDGYIVWNPFSMPFYGKWFAIVAYLAYLILLFNLIPAFPLDGGQVLRALLWKKYDFRKATMAVTTTGYIFAIILVIVGLGLPMAQEPGQGGRGTTLLLALGIFIGLSCWFERKIMKYRSESEYGEYFDFSSGDVKYKLVDEKKKPGFWERRRTQKEAARRKRETEEARSIRERVDELLAKVSREGMTALTEEEKSFLKEASKKYKSS